MPEQPEKLYLDSDQISLSEYSVIAYWCKSLGCSEVQLAEAIAFVGHSASEVRAYLRMRPDTEAAQP